MTAPARTNGAAASVRTVLFWMHLTVGLVAGLVILVMAVTGVVLAFERPVLDGIADGYRVEIPREGLGIYRLPLDTMLVRGRTAATAAGRSVVSLGLRADTAAAVALGLDDRRMLYLDPYTGVVLGDDAKPRAFFAAVQRWHRWLSFGPPAPARSSAGKAITGACNLAFLLLLLSGPWLWWPRQRSARAFRAVLLLNREARGKARDWNWHHVFGIWAVPVLLAIVTSATFMSYGWPGTIVQRRLEGNVTNVVAGEEGGGAKSGREGERPAVVVEASFDRMMATVVQAAPGWRSMQWRLPRAPKRPVTVTVATGTGARPDQRMQGTFDVKTGAGLQWQTYADGSPFRRFRSWIRPIHTGEAGGGVGQTLAALASAAVIVLVWSGFALAWRRWRSWLSRPAKTKVAGLSRAA